MKGQLKSYSAGVLNCVRALGGYTLKMDAASVFDTPTWSEATYIHELEKAGGTTSVVMNWYVMPGIPVHAMYLASN
jgi:hypothetical protein